MMAFYTSRVDDNGVEIERRQSARSLASSSYADSANRPNISVRSSTHSSKSGIRYVNQAAYIEKSSDDLSLSTGGGDAASRNGEHRAASENQSNIVPPLDLESEDNYPTPRDYTFSYRKHCEAAKIELKPDLAFETWLSAKKKLMSDEAAKRKKAEEQKRKELEERKRLAEEKFHSWLASKNRSQVQRPHSHSHSHSHSNSHSHSQSTITSTSSSHSVKSATPSEMNRAQLSEEEARLRLEEWERSKRLEDERRRIRKRQEEQRRREIEEERRSLAAQAWEKWIADADKKPKPVPLNRGIFTLRGTISNIYVNPNEWQPIIPVKEED